MSEDPGPLADFARKNTLATRRAPTHASPDGARCLEVEKVAARSVAGLAGVAPHDLLVSVDGRPAGSLDPELPATAARTRSYLFFRAAASERVSLEATGIDIGVSVRATAKAIAASYKPEARDPGPLLSLWEQGEWDLLEKLATAVLGRNRSHPSLVLLGAAQYENGRRGPGIALVQEYLGQHVSKWTIDYAAVGTYYMTRELARAGRKQEAARAMREVFERFPCARAADAVLELTGERPSEPRQWIGKRIGFDYDLGGLEGSPRIGLRDSLAALRPRQGLLICLLVGYRGNGPYNGFMQRYLSYAEWFGSYLPGLHVITSAPERRADRAFWYEAEDKVRAAGLPFALAYDPEDVVAAEFAPTGSPYVLLVDRTGKVHSEGELSPRMLWEGLANLEDDA